MVLPVSIGDVIMLSKLAFRLGQAFTTGRKSAGAEFQEIQNQLYGLSKALDLLSQSNICDPSAPNHDVLGPMINNCQDSLKFLEAIVDKYTTLEQKAGSGGQDSGRRWSSQILQNWKKVKWTTEGGDLERLKSNLAVHITSLNLVLSAEER